MTQQCSRSETLETWFNKHQEELLEEYFTFLRFKSISTLGDHKQDMRDCAHWLLQLTESMGFTAEIWETPTQPIVYAEYLDAGPDAPTVLIYNHYDVQPVDPLELWHSDPFEPTIRDGEIYARGAQDNKGQCYYVLAALKSLLDIDGALPVNVKLVIEGEEEAGSAGLLAILESRREKLQADTFLVVDMGIHAMDQPAITLGLRGATFATVTVTGSSSDLHSGLYGGVAFNPLHALVQLLAELRDAEGRITIPGFYDAVETPDAEELRKLDLEFDPEEYRASIGFLPTGGEAQWGPLERAWLRPTLEINGIGGGYFGEGVKTVIPAQAVAKLSCRLVPNQDPETIGNLLKEYLESRSTEGYRIAVELAKGGGPAVRTPLESPSMRAASQAITEVFQQPCRYILSGGSIPVIAAMGHVVGAEPILLGLGLPSDNMHAPNEHFGIQRIKKGMAVIGSLISLLAKE